MTTPTPTPARPPVPALPPACCPVCGAEKTPSQYVFLAGYITQIYDCGATFSGPTNTHPHTPWHDPCPYAVAAAYRCGATLAPTAQEAARQALVAAAVAWTKAQQAYWGEDGGKDEAIAMLKAEEVSQDAATAYLATLEPTK